MSGDVFIGDIEAMIALLCLILVSMGDEEGMMGMGCGRMVGDDRLGAVLGDETTWSEVRSGSIVQGRRWYSAPGLWIAQEKEPTTCLGLLMIDEGL